MGGISLVDEGFKSSDKEYTKTGWDMVKGNVERISGLILDMLNFSSKKKPLYQKVKINSFVQDVAEIYKDKMKDKKAQLGFSLDSKLNTVKIDLQGAERALLNLVSNAYEVIPENKGKIIIGTRLLSGGKTFQISVADNGNGIPPQNLKQNFE